MTVTDPSEPPTRVAHVIRHAHAGNRSAWRGAPPPRPPAAPLGGFWTRIKNVTRRSRPRNTPETPGSYGRSIVRGTRLRR